MFEVFCFVVGFWFFFSSQSLVLLKINTEWFFLEYWFGLEWSFIFFISVLCFRFLPPAVLITHHVGVSVMAEQCLLCVNAISVTHSAPPSKVGAHKKFGGDTAGTADQRKILYYMT